MINCYLKTLKFAIYFFPIIPSRHRFPCLLAAGRETIEANLLLQINSRVSIPATRRQKVQGSTETAISTNCKNALLEFFADSTGQYLILNSLPS